MATSLSTALASPGVGVLKPTTCVTLSESTSNTCEWCWLHMLCRYMLRTSTLMPPCLPMGPSHSLLWQRGEFVLMCETQRSLAHQWMNALLLWALTAMVAECFCCS